MTCQGIMIERACYAVDDLFEKSANVSISFSVVLSKWGTLVSGFVRMRNALGRGLACRIRPCWKVPHVCVSVCLRVCVLVPVRVLIWLLGACMLATSRQSEFYTRTFDF